jgi:glycosyltransferase involved in cell wall biosynthesis
VGANRKPRVLFVDHVNKVLGGAEVNLVELAGHSEARNRWEIEIACAPGGPLDAAVADLGLARRPHQTAPALNELRVVGRQSGALAKLRGWAELRRAARRLAASLRRAPVDLVVSCTNKDHFAAGAAARAVGTSSLWWVNDIISPEFFSWPVRRLFVRQAVSLATRLAPVSNFGREALLREGIPARKVTAILNGIPVERYRRPKTGAFRTELGAAPGEPVFGVVGRITPWKGQDMFLRMARRWRESGRPGRFVILGRAFNEDAPYEQSLREFIAAERLEGVASIAPFRKEIGEAVADLDVLVHCSVKPEPFGRVIIEAMAAGTAVLAARDGGVPEIVSDGVNGALAAPGDEADFLAHLQKLAAAPALREKFAAAGRKTVEECFTIRRVFADFDRLFGEVLADAAPAVR